VSPRVGAVREVTEELCIARVPGALLVVDHVPAAERRTEGLIVVFDGGQIDAHSTLVLAYAELSEYVLVTPDRLGDYLPPFAEPGVAALRT